jgi:ABC-type lipopolysaccharide export system ATPase subunit
MVGSPAAAVRRIPENPRFVAFDRGVAPVTHQKRPASRAVMIRSWRMFLPAKRRLLDEPFAGINPKAIAGSQALVRHLTRRRIGVLIAGLARDIENDPDVRELYLGDDFRGQDD